MGESRDGFYDVVRRRRSVRRFSTAPLEEEKLRRILEVGRLAASAANRQPWKFFLLRGAGKERFSPLLRDHFRDAPALIVACAHPESAWRRSFDGRDYSWVDVSIAVTEMVLAATAEGIGSCWIAAFDPEAAAGVLGLDPGWEPVTAVALGYPLEKGEPEPKKRKSLSEVWEMD